jgi:putative NADPH-quinone reductase
MIVTMDTPKWYYFLMNINAGHNAMRIGVLEFCGIKPVKITSFAPVKSSDDAKRKRWLTKVEKLGKEQK